jgi:hypothetical protein
LHPARPSLTSGSASRTDADSERAIRFLIALMVLTCDPLAIALTAAASARSQPYFGVVLVTARRRLYPSA